MNAKTIDGKAVARRITDEAAAELAKLGVTPGLAVVLVGDDPASHLYVRLKEKACRDIGIAFEKLFFRADADEALVLHAIAALNKRQDVDAILVQLPLPPHLDEDRVIAAIDPVKDVDGFHPENVRLLQDGHPRIVPGLAGGILELVRETGVTVAEKTALVVANSRAFYAPLESALAASRMWPAFALPDDASLPLKTRAADVLVVAVGRPGFVTGAMLKPGAVVIDVGTNRVDGKTVGDVDAASAGEVAAHLTPVPGGVGPVTVAMLLRNAVALAAARRRRS
jgi:methylenetetrahydrofolate dehydrogenase (NADP+)/methenyltetrahydrofolate cyclohydrolase